MATGIFSFVSCPIFSAFNFSLDFSAGNTILNWIRFNVKFDAMINFLIEIEIIQSNHMKCTGNPMWTQSQFSMRTERKKNVACTKYARTTSSHRVFEPHWKSKKCTCAWCGWLVSLTCIPNGFYSNWFSIQINWKNYVFFFRFRKKTKSRLMRISISWDAFAALYKSSSFACNYNSRFWITIFFSSFRSCSMFSLDFALNFIHFVVALNRKFFRIYNFFVWWLSNRLGWLQFFFFFFG